MLLVGPPGTGKTLIARAVAGEAGVPFLSVTGSDFMEMFVGVGASRVRDLFQTARKMGRAIIFVDEIDSIGRKRGAGLGGGHDEREQTLNQMLSEMDGFEATEGIVMMAATNRPDILDPALLRPGRFDRQVVVPLPELERAPRDPQGPRQAQAHRPRRRPRHRGPGHARHVAAPTWPTSSTRPPCSPCATATTRSTPRHFEEARDRVLMGQRRESMALSDQEKELTAYHEAGHAVCAAVLPNADPLHKVTILPIGMALGVTQQLPAEDRHSYDQDYLEDRLVHRHGRAHRRGARVRRRLHRRQQRPRQPPPSWPARWCASGACPSRIGPMAWGSQGAVFLGEDLMHTRDYSDETARVIDEEVERHPPRAGGPLPRSCSTSTATASTSSPGRCSSTRRSTAPRSSASSSWAAAARRAVEVFGECEHGLRRRQRQRGAAARSPSVQPTPEPIVDQAVSGADAVMVAAVRHAAG